MEIPAKTLDTDELAGRVAVVTGGGRGLGREYARLLARHGAHVVVNDFGGERDGAAGTDTPAASVVAEIVEAGGVAVAHSGDVSDWDVAEDLIQTGVNAFGQVDVLVNNAGILRDRSIVNLTPGEWDDVIRVHLRGTAGPTHHVARHWRARSKAGASLDARLINTSSQSGLYGRRGQANYGAAKGGVATFTIIAAEELGPYGVTANALAPIALTRLTDDVMTPEQASSHAPASVAPFVAWLASARSRSITGQVFGIGGASVYVAERWRKGPSFAFDATSTLDVFDAAIAELVSETQGQAPVSVR